jgi:hypothetical protein
MSAIVTRIRRRRCSCGGYTISEQMAAEHVPANGLELSCPAEAGNATWTLGQAGGPSKRHSRPSPPGQLQRVVGRQTPADGRKGLRNASVTLILLAA